MHDAHFHYSDEIIRLQRENHIASLCNAQSEEEYGFLSGLGLVCSVGMHPWQPDVKKLPGIMELSLAAGFMGEIGMDNVWCDADEDLQRQVFEAQIEYAEKHQLPVILHTKGCEKEILDIIRKHPNTYVVHWYSCPDYVDEYLEVADYFTVGPSVGTDPTVTELVKKARLSKLLIESDGIDAIEWAIGSRDYTGTLRHTVAVIARLKGLSMPETERMLDDNFARLMKRKG